MIAADIPTAQISNFSVHDTASRIKAVFQFDRVTFSLETSEKLSFERFGILQVPWCQLVNQVGGNAVRSAHQHVVEEMFDVARHGPPADLRHDARLRNH